MIQRTIETRVQVPTHTRQTACITIFVRLHRRRKQPQRHFGIAEVATAVTVLSGRKHSPDLQAVL